MKRFVLAWLILLIPCESRSQSSSKPNVLLVVIDDLNDWVGCLDGHPDAFTPNLDRLAQRGTLFANAHCQAPLCGPSRASFLTGQYPSTLGLYGQPKKTLAKDQERFVGHTLPQHFAAHGYRTFGVGKITHGIPLSAVVDEAGPSGGSGPKPPNDHRFHYRPAASAEFSGTQTDWAAFPEFDRQMPDHQTAAWAVERLRQTHDQPFFMAVGFHRPHVPFYVPEKWFQRYPLDQVSLPPIQDDDLVDVPSIGRAIHEVPRFPQLPLLQADNNAQWRRCVQAYLACTTFVDAQLGKVMAAVPDNTVVAVISDHGYHLGEKNRVAKHSLWPESTRVPMVIVPVDGHAGQVTTTPVGLIDLFPTLCELARVPVKPGLEGMSLVPLLRDATHTLSRAAIRTTYARRNHSLRSATHHYVRYENGEEEYYDLRIDPHAWKNLAPTTDQTELEVFRKLLPSTEAAYHPASSTSPVNAWFRDHFSREMSRHDEDL